MQLLPGKTPIEKLATFVATGFGLGVLAPFASGTWGSIPGVALAYATTLLPWWWQVAACLALSAAAVPLCGIAEKVFDRKDDGRIVADEWMLYPIGVIGIQLVGMPWCVADDFAANLYSLAANWALYHFWLGKCCA